MKIILICTATYLISLCLTGCTDKAFQGMTGQGDSSDTESGYRDQSKETGKPSEDGEGVPGYLVEPEKVSIEVDRTDQQIRIKAPQGIVKSLSGSPDSVIGSIYGVEESEFSSPQQISQNGYLYVVAKRLLQFHVNADGSFISQEFSSDGYISIVVSTIPQANPELMVVTENSPGQTHNAKANIDVDTSFAPLQIHDFQIDTAALQCSVNINSACWFLSNSDQNCTQTCAKQGLIYSEQTRTYAGSNGSFPNCVSVMNALGVNATEAAEGADNNIEVGLGCVLLENVGILRVTAPTTTADGGLAMFRRACACE